MIIPQPRSFVPGDGRFRFDRDTQIVLSDPASAELRGVAARLQAEIGRVTGLSITIGEAAATASTPNTVALQLTLDGGAPESYQLRVTPSSIALSASSLAGLFYATQTLGQLLRAPADEAFGSVLAVQIDDAPRFRYRGMHLDVARHLFPVVFIKKYIDLIARYKMNRFHWHLTDDQGWRLEIEKYPLLTEVGANRAETLVGHRLDVPQVFDGQPYGGFYTQDEVREIVAYARERFVTIVPEIEMPGHALAALASYPEYACTPGPFEVATYWGIFEDIYCPSEATFGFLQDVLTEVMDLFPGEYIHIGGDEVPKLRWEQSSLAQDVITREGLANEDELQSYFIGRIETFLRANNRRLIGWDEILEGGLAPGGAVMSWRGVNGGIAAAQQGHDVVMTPSNICYFDHYQADPSGEPLAIGGLTTLEDVYAFEPVPDVLSEAEASHILGAQANVWTEYIKTSDHVEYMILPRMLALSEVVWSPSSARDLTDFKRRVDAELLRLDGLGVNHHSLSE